jgi:hypothetical protein
MINSRQAPPEGEQAEQREWLLSGYRAFDEACARGELRRPRAKKIKPIKPQRLPRTLYEAWERST